MQPKSIPPRDAAIILVGRKRTLMAKELIWLDLRIKLFRKHLQDQRSCIALGEQERLALKYNHQQERNHFNMQSDTSRLNWLALVVRQAAELTDLSQISQANRKLLLARQTEEELHLDELIEFQGQIYGIKPYKPKI